MSEVEWSGIDSSHLNCVEVSLGMTVYLISAIVEPAVT